MDTTHNYAAPDPVDLVEVTVQAGSATSSTVDLRGFCLVGVATPAVLTSTSATIRTSLDGGATWLPVYNRDGDPISLALGSSRYVAISPAEIPGLGPMRLVLGLSEPSARTLRLAVRKLG